MLNAIIEHFQREYQNVRFAVEPPVDLAQLKRFNLFLKVRYLRKGLNTLGALNYLPKWLLNRFRIVKANEIDVVLDASGYSYGDPWSVGMMRNRLALELPSLKRRNIPVILLPQALGPFERDEIRSAFLPIYQSANLIWPRDEMSLGYLKSLGETSVPIIQAPDFTNLVQPSPYSGYVPKSNALCVIPNSKMIDKTPYADEYLHFCRGIIEQSLAKGIEAFVLVHEQAEDVELAKLICTPLQHLNVPIVVPNTAKECKWVIAQAGLVVTSRYHGLVSALSEAKPAFSTSWSHKYQALLADYEMPEQLITLDDVNAEIDRVINTLNAPNKLRQLQAHLVVHAKKQRERSIMMWERVAKEFKDKR